MADTMANWVQLLTGEQIQAKVKKIAQALYYKFYKGSNKPVVITCILKGASIFTTDLVRELTSIIMKDYLEQVKFADGKYYPRSSVPKIPETPSLYFIESSSYHDSQTQSKEIEILSLIKKDKFEGRQVILVDELCDNGKTLEVVKQYILKEVPTLTPDDVYTCVAFTKNFHPDKPRNYPLPNLTGFMVPDVWLVGYGLDNNQQLRGLNSLWAKPKAEGVPLTKPDMMFKEREYISVYLQMLEKQTLTYN